MRQARGFTIVEVIVAVLVLSIGLLGLASTAALTTRMIGQGQRYSEASAMATRRFEMLRSRPCAAMGNGTESEGRYTATWTVADVAAGKAKAVRVIVQSPMAGRMRADTFSTTIPC